MSKFFLSISASLGNSTIDWVRSIYFSLFGSSALGLGLKISKLDINTRLLYGAAVALFLIGLLLSVSITNRFKKLEKRFDKEKPAGVEDLPAYYKIQDIKKAYQHLLLYLLFIPAFVFIILAGDNIEAKSKRQSERVLKNESDFTGSFDSLLVQNKKLMMQINLVESKIDSLVKPIRVAGDKFRDKKERQKTNE